MKFKDSAHEKAYYEQLKRCNIHPEDPERKALIYLLTLTEDCRNNFDSIYDKDEGIEGLITLKFLDQGWPTSSDMRCIRLAFNLFNGGTPISFDLDNSEKIKELQRNTPIEIFSDMNSEYFFEAIRIRFERE